MSDYTDIHMQAIEDLNGIINSLRAEVEKLRAENNEAYVFGLHKGKEAAFIDYGIERLRAENEKLREGKWECYEGLKVQVSILKEDKAFLQKRVSELEAGNEKLRAEIVEALTAWRVDREENEKLRAALKPFAHANKIKLTHDGVVAVQAIIADDDMINRAAAALKETGD